MWELAAQLHGAFPDNVNVTIKVCSSHYCRRELSFIRPKTHSSLSENSAAIRVEGLTRPSHAHRARAPSFPDSNPCGRDGL